MAGEPRQQWQPISMLLTVTSLVDGRLETSQEQHQTFLEVKPKLHVPDDATANRAIRVYMEQIGDLCFSALIRDWNALG